MPPPVRKGPLAACAVFVALGIVLIATGDWVAGLMSVLFFGLGGLALLLPLPAAQWRRGADHRPRRGARVPVPVRAR